MVLIVGAIPLLPQNAGAEVLPPAVNEPPFTGQIISFPARDFISADGWAAYPFVDVEVLRANPASPGSLLRIGFAPDVIPQEGLVEVNHPGGACWDGVTPNIVAGDVIRLTAKDANHTPVIIDQTTTANVTITQTVSQIGPSSVELRGTAVTATGAAIDPAQLEVRLISGSNDRFDFNGRRDLRAPRDGTFAIDQTGTWVATFNGLTDGDVSRALAAENRVVWLGANPAAGTEATIFEVGPLVAPGPAAPCTAPLQGAVAAPDRTQIDFPATEVNLASAPETIRLFNAGVGALADLVVSSITITGVDAPQFSVSLDSCTGVPVAVTSSCDIQLTFNPDSAGLKGAVVQILSNAGNTIVAVSAAGLATNVGEQLAVGVSRPAFLGFGIRSVGNTAPDGSVEIKNIGNIPMDIGALDLVGLHAFDFTISANNCVNQSIAPNATCSISLNFTPGGEGDRTASLIVNSNGDPVIVPLTGGGLVTTGLVDISQWGPVNLGIFTARDFVSVGGFDPDEVLTMQIIRHGVVIGEGSAVAGADGIAEINHPGGGCWENVTPNIRAGDVLRVTRSNPTRIYEMTNADVKVTQRTAETSPGSNVVVMKGYARDLATGGPLPLAQIEARIIGASRDPFAINGRRSVRTAGEGVLEYDPVGPSNPDGINWTATWDFSTSPDPAHDVALALSEENRILWLGRDPLALSEMTFWEDGSAVADGPAAPCTAPAEAPSPGIAVQPSSQTFPAIAVGEQALRSFTVRNIGNAPLTISAVSFAGTDPGDFTVVGGTPGAIAVDSTGTFQVRFSPTGLGARSATVQVHDNAVGTPHTAIVTGTGVSTSQAALLATPSSLVFPDTQVGVDSAARTVTVTNEGGAALTFATLPSVVGANAADFRVDETVPGACALTTSLAALETCTVSVIFKPSAVNGRSATLQIPSNDPAGPALVPLSGVSTTTADGTFDPPRRPRDVQVFPVRDYVAGAGFRADEFVRIDVYRNGSLLAQSEIASPRDLDPTDNVFDGFVEVNHAGGVCWANETPDLLPGDVVRAVRLTGDFTVIGGDQTHVAGLSVSVPATEVTPGVVVMTGAAVDPDTGAPLAAGSIEPRITSATTLFDANGRRDLRGGLDGTVTMNGSRWTATFSGLSAADVDRALSGDSKVVWLGRDPFALSELTHWEWGEIPGPDPGCAATAPFNVAEPTLAPASLNAGYAGLGTTAPAATATFTNPGPGIVDPQVQAIVGPHAADFTVADTTCLAPLNPGEQCSVSVTFTAGGLGKRVASLPIAHDGANGISFLLLTGVGVGTPTIASITDPVGHGSVVHVIGTNLISTSSVTIAGIGVAPTVVSDTAVDFIVPATITPSLAVPVVVTTAGGTATRSIQVLPDPPTISSVSPTSGKVGDAVTINGTNLGGATVTFNGVAATVVSNSGTVISTTVPAGATTGLLRVATTGGAATTPFTVIPAPTITSFSPTTARRGAVLTINGTNFVSGQTVVRFTDSTGNNTTTATVAVTFVSSTQIRVTIPNYAVQGLVRITVGTGANAQTATAVFTVELAPANLSLAPTSGKVGDTIAITGNNFLTTSKVSFNGRNATFTIVSPTRINAVVPGGATTGGIQIGNKWGSATSGTFTVIQPPTITGFTPATVTATTRTVTVTGTNFASATSVSLVRGSTTVPMAFTVVSATQIRFTVPATGTGGVTTGLYNIRITNPAGTASSAAALNVTG